MNNAVPTISIRSSDAFSPAPASQCAQPSPMVGNTPVLWIGEPFADNGRGFWAKLEGANPGGMKDRPALHMVQQAKARGDLAPGARIIESTSGTLGLGLALAGTTHDHPVTLVTDPGLEPIVHRMLTAYGVHVELVTTPHPTGGWQQARRDKVRELLAAHPGSWCPDQYTNPDNVDAYESLAHELIAQLGRVDTLVCSVGTGGHSAGVARVLRQYRSDLKLVGVDTVGSTIFGQPAHSRLMRGLGSSIYPDNVDYSAFDEVHWVAPHEAVWSCRTLASTHHASGGWSVGAVALAAGWIARTSPPATRIAAVFPDGPQRYFDTIYNDEYCSRHGLLDAHPPTEPATIGHPSDEVVKRWTRCATVVDPTKAVS
ncbi:MULTISPECIES: PLP-dependent cysteine synthase family protein [Williamsia]|uniref:PLP-dependent cysteine synthase family protein n=1 Tax=Williamsia TaxID=85043 RepID=UPI0003D337B9|nr:MULTISPECIES: PLP-dependent cysteine synthase family protein [Williamsia]ETD34049.1 pyridoxal-5'-phosphate-dependent protein subunit beta [Williamsia sp. D3]PVY22395.1 cysteine synthase A [Williamsia marianensis]PZT89882.1 MAG: PLP-dependent cysteine synthase family protein [Gordonia sp. (in: high G+C Gram-positive bacteria)]